MLVDEHRRGRRGAQASARDRSGLRSAVAILRHAARRTTRIYGVALALSSWWFIRNAWVYGNLDIFGLQRHDLVVIGQPLTGPLTLAAAKRFVSISFQSFWAQFGWMGIVVDERIYLFLWALCAVAVLGLVLFAIRTLWQGDTLSHHQRWSLALVALSLALLAAGVLQYNLTYIQAQGRYFFPAIIAIATFFVLGLREIVSPRYAPLLFGFLFAGMFVLDVVALVRFVVPYFYP